MDAKWQRARGLRKSMTDTERALWRALRDKQLEGRKFRRQYPIAGYIADFVCIEAGLVIELDGGQHAEQVAYDTRRTEGMKMAGYRVIRFWNNEVLENMDGVLEALRLTLLQPHPNPPLQGRGGSEMP
jgi:very-short-patch-repair endonuclease